MDQLPETTVVHVTWTFKVLSESLDSYVATTFTEERAFGDLLQLARGLAQGRLTGTVRRIADAGNVDERVELGTIMPMLLTHADVRVSARFDDPSAGHDALAMALDMECRA